MMLTHRSITLRRGAGEQPWLTMLTGASIRRGAGEHESMGHDADRSIALRRGAGEHGS